MRENTYEQVAGDHYMDMGGYTLYSTISSYQHMIQRKYKHNYSKADKLTRLEEKVKQWTLQLYHTY